MSNKRAMEQDHKLRVERYSASPRIEDKPRETETKLRTQQSRLQEDPSLIDEQDKSVPGGPQVEASAPSGRLPLAQANAEKSDAADQEVRDYQADTRIQPSDVHHGKIE